MAKIQTTEVNKFDGIEPPETTSPAKTLKVICERGEFWFDGVRYHHDTLDDETALKLIKKGYTQIEFQ
jgi:hypothetical protein